MLCNYRLGGFVLIKDATALELSGLAKYIEDEGGC